VLVLLLKKLDCSSYFTSRGAGLKGISLDGLI